MHRPGVEPALQHGVVQRVRHHVQAGPGDVIDEPVSVGVVVGVHGRGVAGRDPAGHPAPDRLGHHHLDKPRMLVVGLVAVDVDLQPVLVGQCHREPDRLHPVLAGQLVVRNAADHVRAEFHRAAHQVLPAVEGQDPLLRERHQLQVDQAADLLAQVGQGPQRAQFRVADVHVAAHVLHPAGQLPAQDLPHPGLHVLVRQLRDPLCPHRDALEQRPGHVRPRLPDGEHRVQVNVRLDQRRRDQPPAQVDDLPGRAARGRRVAGHQPAAGDAKVGKRVLARDPGVAQQQIDHEAIMPRPAPPVSAPRAAIHQFVAQ